MGAPSPLPHRFDLERTRASVFYDPSPLSSADIVALLEASSGACGAFDGASGVAGITPEIAFRQMGEAMDRLRTVLIRLRAIDARHGADRR